MQTPFGWNNAKLQSIATDVTFTYQTAEEYTAVCTFVTGEGTKAEKVHNVPREVVSSVNAQVAYDARVRNQITGFTLTGFGQTTSPGTVPAFGGACAGGTWTSVALTSSQGAHYGTMSTLLMPTVL